jgi:hypothetical protein
MKHDKVPVEVRGGGVGGHWNEKRRSFGIESTTQ